MIWLAANLVVTTLLTGTLFVPGVGYGTALLMIVLGTLAGAVVLTLVGNIGTRTGLPTMALTRGAFGTRGSLLPVAANVVILMGWSWVQAMLAGLAVDYLVASVTGFSNPALFAVLCQVLVVCLAIFGHEGIARVEPWLAVLILLIMGYVFATAFGTFSFGEFTAIAQDQAIGLTTITVLDVVIATAISWTVLSADFNRLARSQRAGMIGSGIGYSLSTILSMSLGATAIGFVVLSGGEAVPFDPAVIVGPFGWPLAVVIFMSVMATNTMVVYGMVTSVVNALPGRRLPFLGVALVLGLVSVIGSTWFGLLEQFTGFLVMIGAFFVPVFAIMIADYYLVRRANYTVDVLRAAGGRYWYTGGVNWIAIVVWVVGAVLSYLWTYVWISPVGATLPAFAVSLLLYLGGMKAVRARAAEGRQRHLAEQVEDDAVRA
ncbi:purine-cytosine transporter [Arthrobacter sp. E918]|uniref:Purine-cytosine transporter n=2 Tax=Arthrobacter mobilis TaxID=2724944 RepID=A0A7X6K6Q0_9MICC|nr:purine-cytosine transporter [Arthrobacter mobilis]